MKIRLEKTIEINGREAALAVEVEDEATLEFPAEQATNETTFEQRLADFAHTQLARIEETERHRS